jgi:hypothetical protein
MEKINIRKTMERTIAHSDEVDQALGDWAFMYTQRARALLAVHRKTGSHRITQTKGKVDHFVNLEGPDSISVELGHHNHRGGQFVQGLHILRNAFR